MPSWIRTIKSGTQPLAAWTQHNTHVAAPKAKVTRRLRDVLGAELKCCAPLDPLPLLSATPASARNE